MIQLGFGLLSTKVLRHSLKALGEGERLQFEIVSGDAVYLLSAKYQGKLSQYLGCVLHKSQCDYHILSIEPIGESLGAFFNLKLEQAPVFYCLDSLADTILSELIENIYSQREFFAKKAKKNNFSEFSLVS